MTAIGQASFVEIELMLDWAAVEGWNPGLDDARAFQAADPHGFFVARIDDRTVASISVVNHSDSYAFLGLYIVDPEHRGLGIGKKLWDHAIEHAGDRVIGLDGVPEQQANYARSGFQLAGATERFTGMIEPAPSGQVRRATQGDVAALIAQEASHSGQSKPAYLSHWYTATLSRGTWIYEGPEGSRGHATLRQCRDGSKIGPLCATDISVARGLIQHCAQHAQGAISIDVPQNDGALREICVSFGLTPSFETARMYRAGAPGAPNPLFAVCTLELG